MARTWSSRFFTFAGMNQDCVSIRCFMCTGGSIWISDSTIGFSMNLRENAAPSLFMKVEGWLP